MKVHCPGCNATLKLAQPPESGQKFQCPQCDRRFKLQGKSQSSNPKTPTRKKKAAARPKRSNDEFEEFDEFDDPWNEPAPQRRRQPNRGGSKKKKQSSDKPAWLLPVAVGGGGIAVVSLVIIAVVMLFGKKDKPAPKDNNIAQNEQKSPTPDPLPRKKFNSPVKSPEFNPPPKKEPVKPKVNLPKINTPDAPAAKGGGRDGQLDPNVLARLKKATVLLRVTAGDGSRGTGSGFFAVDKSIIITNAHVVGMLEPGTRKPRKVEIVLNSGQRDEKVVSGFVTAVDRTSDLAVVQYRTGSLTDFPTPLKVFSAKKLLETQRVYVCGFPFGEKLGKEIAVRISHVASLRRDKHGDLKQVQVSGGMNPGNSGGPVVDSNGNVVGIAVAGIPGTTINFAIPGDSLYRMLDGRIAGVTLGEAKQVDKKFHLPVNVRTIDPLRRIKSVKLTWWVGKQGQPRDPTSQLPAIKSGDSQHQTVALTYQNGVARGSLQIPAVPEGKTVFIQPVYESESGTRQWMASVNYDPGPLLDQLTVLVSLKPRTGRGDLYLNSRSTMTFDFFGGETQSLLSHIDARLVEQTLSANGQASQKQYNVGKIEWGVSINNKGVPHSAAMQQAMRHFGGVSYLRDEDSLGLPTRTRINFARVPQSSQQQLLGISKQMLDSLDLTSIPIQAGRKKPGTRWSSRRKAPFNLPGTYRSGSILMTYTYQGVATYYRHRVAVIKISGTIPTTRSRGVTVFGRARGNAYLDLSRRRIIVADITLDFSMIADIGKDKAKASGQTRIKMSRIPPDWKKQVTPRKR